MIVVVLCDDMINRTTDLAVADAGHRPQVAEAVADKVRVVNVQVEDGSARRSTSSTPILLILLTGWSVSSS
jgi:hypothetical protein